MLYSNMILCGLWEKSRVRFPFIGDARACDRVLSAIKEHLSIESIKVEGYHVFKLPFVPFI